ncbi:MAG: tRNA (N6-threonylcarbamoyladenosine(37)-N6)-methyltransferase TrmO [Bacteroidales bacterium]|nr:tRNA (N6-threonylcarbamoyladenosine(37)-N6)-methyltransferase TrmO [Bacteroidales bacterium]
MEIKTIAFFRSPFPGKFGIPRQAGLAPDLRGRIVFEPEFRNPDALRGLDGFEYIWLIWEFSANTNPETTELGAPDRFQPTVRPPRLGGNTRVGVFASRSPFRPNPLGLSSVRLESIDYEAKDSDGKPIGPVVNVLGADLMDGTPIYDIKPYVEYADSHPGVRSGFVSTTEWEPLQVEFPVGIGEAFPDIDILREVLSLDPRPRYHDDPSREYGMSFGGREVRFKVSGDVLTVLSIK